MERHRLDVAAERGGVQTAVENGAELNAFLLGVAGAALEGRASTADAGVTSLLSVFGALRGLVRTNPAVSVTLGVVADQGKAAATEAWATSAQESRREQHQRQGCCRGGLHDRCTPAPEERGLFPPMRSGGRAGLFRRS